MGHLQTPTPALAGLPCPRQAVAAATPMEPGDLTLTPTLTLTRPAPTDRDLGQRTNSFPQLTRTENLKRFQGSTTSTG